MIRTIYQLSFEHNGYGGLRDQIVKVVERAQDSIVQFTAHIPEDRRSSRVLGNIRQGTGVIIDSKGYILTVGYLMMEAEEVQVMLHDERIFPAEVVGLDFESGLGVLRITEPVDLQPLTLGRSERVNEGQITLTIGHSSEVEAHIVTNGRILDTSQFIGYWEYLLERAFYVVPQNPAFGGSPLFNIEGEVIGVVSLQLNQHQGMNLAIPVELLAPIKTELIRYGRAISRMPRNWIGLYHAPFREGIIVIEVMPDSPAEKGGLRKGDIILYVNGLRVRSEEQFLRTIWEIPLYQEFEVTLLREISQKTVTICGMDFYDFYNFGDFYDYPGH